MKKLHTLIGTALIFGASSASAGDVVELNNTDLDRITAGAITLSSDGLANAFGDVTGPGAQLNLTTNFEGGVEAEEDSGNGFSIVSSESDGATDLTSSLAQAGSEGEFEATGSGDDIDGSTVGNSETNVEISADSALASGVSDNVTNISVTGGDGGSAFGSSMSNGSLSVDFNPVLP